MATPTYTLRHITLLTVFSFAVFLPLGDSESLRLYKTTTKDGADFWCYPVNCTSPFERCSVNGTHDRCVPCEEGYFFVDNISSDDWRGSSPVCLSKVKECEHECADLAILVNKEECGVTERAECACDLTKAFGTDPNLCEEYDERCDVPNKQLTMNGSCEDCPSGTEKLAANNSRCVPKQTILSTVQPIIDGTSENEKTERSKLPPTITEKITTPTQNDTHAHISDTEDGSSLTPGHIVLIVIFSAAGVLVFAFVLYKVIVWCRPNGDTDGIPEFMLNHRAAGNDPEEQYTLILVGQGANGHVPSGQGAGGQGANGHVPSGQVVNGHIPSGQVANGNIPNGQVVNGHIPSGQVENGHILSGQVGYIDGDNADNQGIDCVVTSYLDSGDTEEPPLSFTIEVSSDDIEGHERRGLLSSTDEETTPKEIHVEPLSSRGSDS